MPSQSAFVVTVHIRDILPESFRVAWKASGGTARIPDWQCYELFRALTLGKAAIGDCSTTQPPRIFLAAGLFSGTNDLDSQ